MFIEMDHHPKTRAPEERNVVSEGPYKRSKGTSLDVSEPGAVATGPKLNFKLRAYLTTLYRRSSRSRRCCYNRKRAMQWWSFRLSWCSQAGGEIPASTRWCAPFCSSS